MAKFSGSSTQVTRPRGPLATAGKTVTYEGGVALTKIRKSELFSLAVTNMVNETSFYESAVGRQNRFVDLVRDVTKSDPAWVASFIQWLRYTGNMRSAPAVMAVEYVRAGGPSGRRVVASACRRADEPAEILGYCLANYGRRIPMAIKRGIADAAARLYDEQAALKYDGNSRGVRMADVLELCHPAPSTGARPLGVDWVTAELQRRLSGIENYSVEQAKSMRDEVRRELDRRNVMLAEVRRNSWQSNLFKHLLDRRHGNWTNDSDAVVELREQGLNLLADAYSIDAVEPQARRQFLTDFTDTVQNAGYTWERLSGWLPDGMDAQAWEAIIPSMGYMALLRNLRNFEQAKVSKSVLRKVADRLADPEQVAKSRQFPYRFWSAYRNSGTMLFGPALEDALELSVQNVPEFTGRTLVAVDTSASMEATVSGRSKVRNVEIGALFAASLGARSDVDLMIYANQGRIVKGTFLSVMRTIDEINRRIGEVGHGTETWTSVLQCYDGHDRIVVFTDMQDHPARARVGYLNPEPVELPDVPIYVWDLAGYKGANVDTSVPGRYLMSGFTDAAFKLIAMLEQGLNAAWPWENE